MGFFSDVWDDIKDTASDVWSDLKDGDILGAVGGVFELGLNISTGGLYSVAKVGIEHLLDFDVSTPTPEQDYKDRKVMTRGASNPRQVIYGKTMVGCQVVYIESSGVDDEYLHLVVVFASHSCNKIQYILFGEANAVFDGVVQPAYSDILFSQHLGAQTVADSLAVANAPNWTSSHKLLGQTYAYFRLKYDKDKYNSGVPVITALIEGKNDIYWPETGQRFYTDNHAACALDYMNWDRGLNIPLSEMDYTTFVNAINVSDEQTPKYSTGGGATENRYTVNGTLKLNTAPLENLNSMLKSGASQVTYAQGIWKIIAGEYKAPVMSFDESDLVSDIKFAPGSGKNSRINIGKGTYISPLHDYEPIDFVQIAVAGYIASDLEELPIDFNMPFTNSGTMARRLAKIAIEQSRFGLGVEVTLKYRALELAIGDRLNLSIDGLGWVNKVFRVESLSFDLSSGVKLSLREDSTEIYDWTEGEALEAEVPPAVNLPNPFVVSAPVITSVTEELYFTNVASQIKTRLDVSWTAGVSAIAFDVQYNFNAGGWVDAVTNHGGSPVRVNDFEVGSVQFRARATNGIGIKSDWSTVFNYDVVGKTAPPPDVIKMYIAGGTLGWEYLNAPLDLAGFEVRYNAGDKQTWSDAVHLHQGLVSQTAFSVIDLVFGVKTFLVKAIDTTGNESVNPAVVIYGLGDPVLDNIFRNISYHSLGFPGTITNGSINGDGFIVSDQVGTFYNPVGTSVFYDQVGANDFYSDEYLELTYEFEFTPDPADLPGSMTLNTTTLGNNVRFEHDYADNGFYAQFTGKIRELEVKSYKFRLVLPSQFSGTALQVQEVEVVVDVPDIREQLEDIAISAAGTRLPITETYRNISAVTLTLQDDASTGTSVKLVDKNATLGPLVKVYNSSLVAVTGNIDATIGGY